MGLSLQQLALPRQTHSDHILRVTQPGRPEDTDAVITSQPGLCVCVKTADCIPVLLYDDQERQVAAVHAGWRGTVAHIAAQTASLMNPQGKHLHAIIGPGISLAQFEVGDEVYETFRQAGFPMIPEHCSKPRQMDASGVIARNICSMEAFRRRFSTRQSVNTFPASIRRFFSVTSLHGMVFGMTMPSKF